MPPRLPGHYSTPAPLFRTAGTSGPAAGGKAFGTRDAASPAASVTGGAARKGRSAGSSRKPRSPVITSGARRVRNHSDSMEGSSLLTAAFASLLIRVSERGAKAARGLCYPQPGRPAITRRDGFFSSEGRTRPVAALGWRSMNEATPQDRQQPRGRGARQGWEKSGGKPSAQRAPDSKRAGASPVGLASSRRAARRRRNGHQRTRGGGSARISGAGAGACRSAGPRRRRTGECAGMRFDLRAESWSRRSIPPRRPGNYSLPAPIFPVPRFSPAEFHVCVHGATLSSRCRTRSTLLCGRRSRSSHDSVPTPLAAMGTAERSERCNGCRFDSAAR
jgi:hypothetical protein